MSSISYWSQVRVNSGLAVAEAALAKAALAEAELVDAAPVCELVDGFGWNDGGWHADVDGIFWISSCMEQKGRGVDKIKPQLCPYWESEPLD